MKKGPVCNMDVDERDAFIEECEGMCTISAP